MIRQDSNSSSLDQWSLLNHLNQSTFFLTAGQSGLVPALEVLLLHRAAVLGGLPVQQEVSDRDRPRGPDLSREPRDQSFRVPVPPGQEPQQPRHQVPHESGLQTR